MFSQIVPQSFELVSCFEDSKGITTQFRWQINFSFNWILIISKLLSIIFWGFTMVFFMLSAY